MSNKHKNENINKSISRKDLIEGEKKTQNILSHNSLNNIKSSNPIRGITNSSEVNSSNSNLSNKVMKIRKVKSILNENNGSINIKKEFKKDKGSLISNSSSSSNNSNVPIALGNKLTFENVFNFNKFPRTQENNIKFKDNSSNSGTPKPNTNTKQSTPIIINNVQPPIQISIRLNNLNINNYNFPSNKLKKENYSKDSNNFIRSNIYSASSNNKVSNDEKINNNLVSNVGMVNNHYILPKKLKLINNKNSEMFNRKKDTINSKKIETIIDGNNDSFINELADLLGNVETSNSEYPKRNLNAADSVEQTEREKSNEYDRHREGDLEDEEIGLNLQNYINKNIKFEQVLVSNSRVNIAELQKVNNKRPQTSYGGVSARQKSLQKSLRQQSSRALVNDDKHEELFPMPEDFCEKNEIGFINFKNKLHKF